MAQYLTRTPSSFELASIVTQATPDGALLACRLRSDLGNHVIAYAIAPR